MWPLEYVSFSSNLYLTICSGRWLEFFNGAYQCIYKYALVGIWLNNGTRVVAKNGKQEGAFISNRTVAPGGRWYVTKAFGNFLSLSLWVCKGIQMRLIAAIYGYRG